MRVGALRPGLLMARTVAIGGTFALAAALAARTDAAHAAAHQACLQVCQPLGQLKSDLHGAEPGNVMAVFNAVQGICSRPHRHGPPCARS